MKTTEVHVLELRMTPGRVEQVREFLERTLGDQRSFVVRVSSEENAVEFGGVDTR